MNAFSKASDNAPRAQAAIAGERRARLTSVAGLATLCCIAALSLGACTTTTHVNGVQATPLVTTPTKEGEIHVAEVALESGDISMAKTIYARIVQADPRSVVGLVGLGNTLYAVGDFTRAGVYFQQANQVAPDAIEPLMGMGRVAIRQRRLDDAIATYQQVLAKTPKSVAAASGLGVAMDMKGDHTGAQRVFREALQANPGDPSLSINLGLSLVLGGNAQEGSRVLLDVSRFPDAPPQARQDLALAYGFLGDNAAASEILSSDLSRSDVDSNLRFYTYERARMTYRPARPDAVSSAPLGGISLPLTESGAQ